MFLSQVLTQGGWALTPSGDTRKVPSFLATRVLGLSPPAVLGRVFTVTLVCPLIPLFHIPLPTQVRWDKQAWVAVGLWEGGKAMERKREER